MTAERSARSGGKEALKAIRLEMKRLREEMISGIRGKASKVRPALRLVVEGMGLEKGKERVIGGCWELEKSKRIGWQHRWDNATFYNTTPIQLVKCTKFFVDVCDSLQ